MIDTRITATVPLDERVAILATKMQPFINEAVAICNSQDGFDQIAGLFMSATATFFIAMNGGDRLNNDEVNFLVEQFEYALRNVEVNIHLGKIPPCQ